MIRPCQVQLHLHMSCYSSVQEPFIPEFAVGKETITSRVQIDDVFAYNSRRF